MVIRVGLRVGQAGYKGGVGEWSEKTAKGQLIEGASDHGERGNSHVRKSL